MNIAIGSVLNIAPATPGWTVTIHWSGDDPETRTFPVIGWATVVTAHMPDGITHTAVQAAFNFDGDIFTEAELREHTPTLPVSIRVNDPAQV